MAGRPRTHSVFGLALRPILLFCWEMRSAIILREARRRAGITQAELASRAGTTQSAIARIDRGASAPSFEHLTDLDRLCGFELQVRHPPLDDREITLFEENRAL